MIGILAAASLLALELASGALAAGSAQQFVQPAPCPTCYSQTYVGANNGTLRNGRPVRGRVFSRFIQIWLENTDYNVAASSPVFQELAKQGITLSSYLSLTHPSEPNYIASISGDFWGLGDDRFFHAPNNITTVVDLLEAKGISWATYQENMPHTAYLGDYSQQNYVNPTAGSYNYYVRKHNPLIIHDRISNVTERAKRIRNFNDFAADVNASAIPQWSFITPNLINDAHDTTIDYASSFLSYFLLPLLKNPRFNSGEGEDGTLIVLTFDENSNYAARNNVFTLLLGTAVPKHLHGTTDDTLYSHYSTISTVEGNWGLDNLGRGDVNKTLGNVFDFVAKRVGFRNTQTPRSQEPLTNLTGIYAGPFNPARWIPFYAPPKSQQDTRRFGGRTLYFPGLNKSLTQDKVGPAVNLPYAAAPNSGVGNIVPV